jgi:hypothetical protein
MARWQLDGDGGCNGNLIARDNEERRERNGNVGAASGWSDKGQRGIKT